MLLGRDENKNAKVQKNKQKGTRNKMQTSKQSSLVFCERKRQRAHTHTCNIPTSFKKKYATHLKTRTKPALNNVNQHYTTNTRIAEKIACLFIV